MENAPSEGVDSERKQLFRFGDLLVSAAHAEVLLELLHEDVVSDLELGVLRRVRLLHDEVVDELVERSGEDLVQNAIATLVCRVPVRLLQSPKHCDSHNKRCLKRMDGTG